MKNNVVFSNLLLDNNPETNKRTENTQTEITTNMYIIRSLPMIRYAPLVAIVSYGLIYMLACPSEEQMRMINHLDYELMRSPLDEHALSKDQCLLMENFYDLEMYNDLVESMYTYYTATSYLILPLISVMFTSAFCSILAFLDILF